MSLKGKYDFPSIEKYGLIGLRAALASSSPWLTKFLGNDIISIGAEWIIGWATNKGLVILNLAAIPIMGKWDQKNFDDAMDQALILVPDEEARAKLTPEQIKAIDDKVIEAFNRFARLTKPKEEVEKLEADEQAKKLEKKKADDEEDRLEDEEDRLEDEAKAKKKADKLAREKAEEERKKAEKEEKRKKKEKEDDEDDD